MEYSENDQLQATIDRLIGQHHQHLEKCTVKGLLKEGEVGKKITETPKGKTVKAATASKLSMVARFLCGVDFVLVVN